MLKNAKKFVEPFKNYASYIHTFSLTDNSQGSRKKGKKKKTQFQKQSSVLFRSVLFAVFYKKGVLKNFAEFRGKHLCQTGKKRPATLLKMRLCHNCFSRTPFLKNTSGGCFYTLNKYSINYSNRLLVCCLSLCLYDSNVSVSFDHQQI